MEDAKQPDTEKKVTRKRRRILCLRIAALTAVLSCALSSTTLAAPADVIESLLGGTDSQALHIILELTLIALVPTLLLMMTGFTRIVIVLSMVRNALGLQSTPPNMVIIGLALFLTYFVMNPVLTQVSNTALEPYINDQITYQEFSEAAMKPFREFMLKETYQSDLNYFCNLADVGNGGKVQDLDKIPNHVVISAFITSELKHAFAIGLFIYIPFIIIDMVVASTLMAMGMMMLPPATISMPFKIMLFVLVDGWQLTIGTLIGSF
jgi:flagellar biosynthetic protein FliP